MEVCVVVLEEELIRVWCACRVMSCACDNGVRMETRMRKGMVGGWVSGVVEL